MARITNVVKEFALHSEVRVDAFSPCDSSLAN